RTAPVHWQRLCVDGGATGAGDGRAALLPAPGSRPSHRTPGAADAAATLWLAYDAASSASGEWVTQERGDPVGAPLLERQEGEEGLCSYGYSHLSCDHPLPILIFRSHA